MWVTICNRQFNTDSIHSITITGSYIQIDTEEDFYNLYWRKEEDIIEARQWINLQNITEQEINNAISIIRMLCNSYINEKEQCNLCPLKKLYGCIFQQIPIDWRNKNATGINETEQYISFTIS